MNVKVKSLRSQCGCSIQSGFEWLHAFAYSFVQGAKLAAQIFKDANF